MPPGKKPAVVAGGGNGASYTLAKQADFREL
jgi:hypothetical protein